MRQHHPHHLHWYINRGGVSLWIHIISRGIFKTITPMTITHSNLSVLIDHLSSTDFGLLMQQNELRTGEDEGKQERLNKTVTTFPFIYVIIRSSALANGVSKTT